MWGIANSASEPPQLMINLPIDSYNNSDLAIADASNYSSYEISTDYRGTAFLVARFTVGISANGNDWTIYSTESLRGTRPNTQAGGGAGGTGVTSYLGLEDTDTTYLTHAGKLPVVNPGETGLELTSVGLVPTAGIAGDTLGKVDGTDFNSEWVSRVGTINQWVPGTYRKDTLAKDNGGLYVSVVETSEQPSPQVSGDPFNIYTGTGGSNQVASAAKKVISGNTYVWAGIGQINHYRVNVVVGNYYTTYITEHVGTADEVINILDSFTATSTGWLIRNVNPVIVNNETFKLTLEVNEPDPEPITLDVSYSYTVPQNATNPNAGQITHATKESDVLRIHYTDNDTTDRKDALDALTIGDIINSGTTRWSISGISDQPSTSHFRFTVAPATTEGAGVKTFTLETVTTADISYFEDDLYWSTSPYSASVTGELLIDGIDQTKPDSAFGIDMEVQAVTLSDEWFFLAGEQGVVGAPEASGATWGLINGTLSSQIDLQNALDAKLNHTNGVTTGVYESVIAVPVLAIDVATSNVQTKTISIDSTFTFTGWTTDASAVTIELTAAGTEVVTWTGVTWAGGTAPTLSTFNRYVFTSVDNGATIRGSIIE